MGREEEGEEACWRREWWSSAARRVSAAVAMSSRQAEGRGSEDVEGKGMASGEWMEGEEAEAEAEGGVGGGTVLRRAAPKIEKVKGAGGGVSGRGEAGGEGIEMASDCSLGSSVPRWLVGLGDLVCDLETDLERERDLELGRLCSRA